MKIVWKIIATGFFIGFSPVAPGTVASILASFFVFFLWQYRLIFFVTFSIFLLFGTFAADWMEKQLHKKDPSCVVVDEITGIFVTFTVMSFFIKSSFWYRIISSFLLFRLFDIIKIWPINILQRLKGGLGIMADDFVAGIFAGLTGTFFYYMVRLCGLSM